MSVRVYGLDNCDTCRKARNWLERFKIDFQFIDYRAQKIAPESLKAWSAQVGGWDTFINRASPTWRNLPPARKSPGSDAEWTLLLREHPALVRRPLLVFADGRVHQGFSDNGFRKLFDVKSGATHG
ncbi:Spx/MgsR family RNA polymerase-binding regulatory protein [Dokdonella sp.]|uniref:Spx/MgsR family RNA polymerase-binding regulatory protein n=1 Tax=Dokdonella sp. TaxID=2291710 RepID=UPI0025C33199|nr:Spx/MgsR family RNA polymerase-binding regulatory protein [Dokdonella sp.]MBX3689599.1 Spx/MgsR family RNA polymerase-binding regulatory protein [Dokdonella sp.]